MKQRMPCPGCGGAKPPGYGRQLCDNCLALQRVEQFWEKVDRLGPEECWPWLARRNPKGYGAYSVHNRRVLAHRFAYELAFGECPALLRHKCDNPSCCNPAHLEPGTHQDNADDMVTRGRSTRGEKNPRSILTEAAVRDIHTRLTAGETPAQIATTYGVHVVTIRDVRNGRRWRHVQREEAC